MPVPHRDFKGNSVSIIGIGGSALGDVGDNGEAQRIVDEALENGYQLFRQRLGIPRWRLGRDFRSLFEGQARSRIRHDESLLARQKQSRRAGDAGRFVTSLTDGTIWICGRFTRSFTNNDPDLHFAPDGAIEALTQAKQDGKVRYVGFTGHKDPSIHLKMLSPSVSLRHGADAAQSIRRIVPKFSNVRRS